MKTVKRTRTFDMFDASEVSAKIIRSATIIMFDEREYECPGLVTYKRGKVYISDGNQGLAEWSKELKQYESHCYMMARPIGQFKGVLVEK